MDDGVFSSMRAAIVRVGSALALGFGLLLAPPAVCEETLHHDLQVRLEPSRHRITVVDRIDLPAAFRQPGEGPARFVLHAGLEVTAAVDGFVLEALGETPDGSRYGINAEGPGTAEVPLREYRLRPSREPGPGPVALELRYHGEIHHPLVEEGEEYARSFSRTPGTIEPQGVVLSGSTWWLPDFGESLVTFRVEIELPEGWDAVSQGERIRHDTAQGKRTVTWDSPEPMDEVYLVAAPFTEYSRPAGDVTAYAFLRAPDPNLAAKYLEATAQYVEMYRKLIGPYPYRKFALVENFWDTGYGMPSFTLLGPKIIRFPFILHSSYPHEILHNWWGNSVFVDYASGNWCEGLTAYLADHLIKEGQGRGADYRRDTLNKYRSFVRGEKDFALTEFRARHSSATEAVGYGKSLMLWHMLRRKLGDGGFSEGLQRFYRENRFRRASFADLEAAFAQAAAEDLHPFFEQWVHRTGAPELRLEEARWQGSEAGGKLALALRQVQAGEPYRLDVPVAITLPGEPQARLHTLEMDGPVGSVELTLPAAPLRVDVDPEFDLFRRLDPFEIPATLAQLFGAERVTIVLPEADDSVGPAEWEVLARSWSAGDTERVRVVRENEIDALPAGRAVWILGSRNRWSSAVVSALDGFGAAVAETTIRTTNAELPREDHCFAFVVRHPADADLALGWIGADRAEALPGLARKLPHYGKYSFVAFAGAEPSNVAKGQWPVLGSPLARLLGEGAVARGATPDREPLARLEPVFDPQRILSHVYRLTDDAWEGRGVGTQGLVRATDYVADAFAAAGLEPGGEDGTWFQTWAEPDGPQGRPVTLRNVIGLLPGSEAAWDGQSVVVGAHVDHLGYGWPDVHSGDEGKLHPGADDNASGVAVLLELAALLGRDLEPRRNIVFVAFTAEEWGLRGSRHYVEAMRRWPTSEIMTMINLDTVGRLGEDKITVFGTGSATEWAHIVRGIGFTTGIEAKSVADDLGGSDQKSFLEAGVPAVQVFSGAHEDYHRPTDLPEKLDAEGMVRVATFVREALVYLSEREARLTSTLSGEAVPSAASPPASSGRRVSLGTLPEFSFPGPGVQIADVMPDTPAAAAGLRPGDLIVSIDGEVVPDVRGYAGILRAHDPGDTIRIRIRREGEELEVEATLVAR